MKLKLVFIAIGLLSLNLSCNKEIEEEAEPESSTGIVGEWKLIEELHDPGNGSGTFQPVSSNKIIIFLGNGTFTANGEMCTMENQASTNHSGTYDASFETFAPDNCMSTIAIPFTYSVTGNTLILTYPCTEGCKHKYARI